MCRACVDRVEDTGSARVFSRQRTAPPRGDAVRSEGHAGQSVGGPGYPGPVPLHAPRRGTTLLLAAVGGLVCDAGFPGLGAWPLTFVAVALLFLALARDSARWNLLVGLVFGLAFFLPHITWAKEAVGVVPWAALSFVEAAFIGLMGSAWAWARRGAVIWHRSTLQVPVFALLWVGAEEARSIGPFGGFPWGRLAFSQADSPLGRFAWLGGTPLVSGLVVVVGVLLALAVVALRRVDVGTASGLVLAGVAVMAVGFVLPLDTAAQDGRLNVAAVQGNVPDRGLDSFDQQREVLENHLAGTLALAERVEADGGLDVVLWPENGSDIDPRVDEVAGRALTEAALAVGAPILVGTLEYPEEGGRLNISLLWDPEQGPIDSYAKQHPAPFAEYIPIRDFARRFSDAVDRVQTDMVPGTEVGLVELPVPRLDRVVGIGDVICFEVAYDDLVRDSVVAGAEVLVVQTNNATFGVTDESTQQLAMSRLRAMEHGRATVQISTVGVSGIISPAGLVRQQTGLFTAEQVAAQLPLRSELTPATRFGDAVAWAVRGLAVACTLAGMAGAVTIRRADRVEAA
ncbi:MAG: apolipoprotein N-acyltransferase [Actinotalea sp.]|nr:apolipoprotein N-acyltransferase [Actinotalea sp.]